MADHPDGPNGVDEPRLPLGEEPPSSTSTGDPSEGPRTLDSGLQPRSGDEESVEDSEPEPENPVPDALDASSTSEGASDEDDDDFEIEVLNVETEPAVELAAVPSQAEETDETEDRKPETENSSSSDPEASEEDEDTLELEALGAGPSSLDDFSHDDYVLATTVEYRDLAEAVEAADQEHTPMSAVAVTMPGLESGVVGFEDVTGETETIDAESTGESVSDLGIRITSALILLGMLIAALWAGGSWFVGFVTVIGMIALGEFYTALRRAGFAPIALIGFLTLIAMMIAGFRYGPFGIVGWFTVGVLAVLLWYAIVVRRDPLANASVTVLGFAWIGVLLSFIGPLAATASFRQMTLAIVLTVAALDVGSYFAGRTFGRTPMSPVLSPNKTYEGLLGGVLLAVAMAVGLSLIDWFAPLDLRGALFLAGVAVALGPFGDLAVSMLKRQIGVKDMGSILPGHGGILDRIDALLFIIPVAYFVFSWLGYFAS